MQVCISLQTDNHASTPPLFSTDRMPFLPRNQQRQSTEVLAIMFEYDAVYKTGSTSHIATLPDEH